jgi:hypothetical protein
MKSRSFVRSGKNYGVFLVTALLLVSCICGCTQLAGQKSAAITVTKPDNFHILVAFVGGPGMDKLIGMEITVTDSRGRNWTQSIGSRETMTALKAPSSQTFTGQYSGKNHVVVTGYFSDGSQKVLIDKDI